MSLIRAVFRLTSPVLRPGGEGAAELAPPVQERRPHGAIVGSAAAVAAVVTVALEVMARNPRTWDLVVRAGLVGTWAMAGLTLLVNPRLNRLGQVVVAAALARAAAVLAAPDAAGWVALALLPAFGLHLLQGLPDGRLVTTVRRRVVVVGYALAAIAGAFIGVSGADAIRPVLLLESALALLFGMPAVTRAYRMAEGSERRQLQWLACAAVAFVDLALVALALRAITDWPRPVGTAVALGSAVLPVALAAITVPALVPQGDRLVMATVTATAVTATLGVAYAVLVLALARVPDREERVFLLLSLVVASVAASTYVSARGWLSDFARALAYGERPPPEELLRSFVGRLSRAVPMEELLRQMAESLHRGMALATAEIWTGSDGVLQRAVAVPEQPHAQLVLTAEVEQAVAAAGPSGPGWIKVWLPTLVAGRDHRKLLVVPVVSSGELLGLILVARTARSEPFSEEEIRVLSDLVREVGLALRTVRLDAALQQSLDEVRRQARELQESRARIVAASDAARLRIERDLHDGVQQHLLALNVKLRLARQLASRDTAGTARLLDQLSADVQHVAQELRNLAHGIYPSLLADRGLGEALGAAAAQATIPTRIETGGLHRYPSELEAAVYFCCAEALHNAAKHAGPTASVTVRVWQESARLMFEIVDDGVGFDRSCEPDGGTGLVNMADRIGAVGGRLDIEAWPGRGTRVSGRIPLGHF